MLALVTATSLIAGATATPADLRIGATRLILGRGRSVTVPIAGPLAKWAKAESDDREIAQVEKTDSGMTVTALRPGDAVVTLVAGKIVKALPVSVRRWSAEFPQQLSATVIGSPATATSVMGAVETSLQLNLLRAPGTSFSYEIETPVAVGAGRRVQIPVRVRTTGPASLANEGRVMVDVENVVAPKDPESALWYSNDPESVKTPQGLFMGDLEAGGRVRLLHHHMNASRSAMYFRVLAINDGDEPVRLGIGGGESGPDKDPVRAGLIAGSAFLRAWPSASGEVVELPPRSFVPLSFRRVVRNQTVSGLFSLVSLPGVTGNGSSVQIISDAVPTFPLASDWRNATLSATPWRITGARPLQQLYRTPSSASVHIYPSPFRDEDVPYRVGGRYGYLRIGQKAVVRQDREGQLDGNFGVTYRYNLKLNNPTAGITPVEVAFQASAGYSAGAFLIDGQFIKTPLVRAGNTVRITKVFLKPGETRTMRLVTIPLSGSSYPATVVIRPVGVSN